MIKDTITNEVVEGDYELEDMYSSRAHGCYSYSKVLDKKSKCNYKCTKYTNVLLAPYSKLFLDTSKYAEYINFNNKKFSII